MGQSENIDFEIVKKRARELRSSVYNPYGSGMKYFIADFYCDNKKTVIELDGPIHEYNLEYDQFRDAEMVNLGLHILRIKNEELQDMEVVCRKIETYLNSIN